jgi:hypothetical protein
MRRPKRFINGFMSCLAFMRWLGWYRRRGPEHIPRQLNPADLEKALEEARFLFRTHGVEVRPLAPDEIPDMPKSATGEEPPMPPKAPPPEAEEA